MRTLASKAKRVVKSNVVLSTIFAPARALLRSQTLARYLKLYVYRFIDKSADEQNLKVNIGGGKYYCRHWRVLEQQELFSGKYSYPRGTIDYPHDLTSDKPFPFKDNSVAFFFCSHTLEHIPLRYCQQIFAEIYRCLKPGGTIRITLPDFDLGYDAYGANDGQFFVKYPGDCIENRFLNFFATYWQDKVSPLEVKRRYESMERTEFANSFTDTIPLESNMEKPGDHINWWNCQKMSTYLQDAGFSNVYRSAEQQSRFPELRGVGLDFTHPEISMFVEATK